MIFLNGKNKRKGMERSPDTGAGEDHHHIEPGTPRTEAHQQLHRSAHEIAEGCAARPGSKAETTRKIPRGPAIQQRPCPVWEHGRPRAAAAAAAWPAACALLVRAGVPLVISRALLPLANRCTLLQHGPGACLVSTMDGLLAGGNMSVRACRRGDQDWPTTGRGVCVNLFAVGHG